LVRRSRAITRDVDANFRARRVAWLGTVLKIAAMLLIFGVIFAFVDPNFDPTHPDAVLAILALALSFGLISLIDDVAQYFYLQRQGESPQLRVHAGNAVIAIISALSSRVFQITPGLLIGSPAGIEEVRETKVEAYLHLVAIAAVALLTLIAWFLAPFVSTNLYFVTILLLIFAVGVQTLFFEMMPLRNLHGEIIFRFNRVLWGALLAIVTWLFLTTMLNPEGEFLSAFTQPNVITLAWTVGIFCVFSAAVWAYFEFTGARKQGE
jgi:hypothetical protein